MDHNASFILYKFWKKGSFTLGTDDDALGSTYDAEVKYVCIRMTDRFFYWVNFDTAK